VDWELIPTNPLAKVKKSRTDDLLSSHRPMPRRPACARRSMPGRSAAAPNVILANHWRRERGYVQLPSLRTVMFTDHVKPLILLDQHGRGRTVRPYLVEC
jgi:hypothetical protein